MAASLSSAGIVIKNCLSRKTKYALPPAQKKAGIIRAGLPASPSDVYNENCGSSVTALGSIILLITSTNQAPRMGNRNLANAYAAKLVVMTVPITYGTTMETEFHSCRQN
ncbi:hypothetical protein D3C76_1419910 [compost metagenome]